MTNFIHFFSLFNYHKAFDKNSIHILGIIIQKFPSYWRRFKKKKKKEMQNGSMAGIVRMAAWLDDICQLRMKNLPSLQSGPSYSETWQCHSDPCA